MLRLAINYFIRRPGQSLLTSLAVATVLAVVLVLEGFYAGLLQQMEIIVRHRGGDLIITQAGVNNFMGARSSIPQFLREQVDNIPGVKATHPLTTVPIIYSSHGRRTPILLVVNDSKGVLTELNKGNTGATDWRITIDRSLAKRYQLSVGDDFILNDFTFTVSAIAKQEAAFFTPLAFVNYDDLLEFYIDSDLASDFAAFSLLGFLTVDVTQNANIDHVRDAIEGLDDSVDVHTQAELVQNDRALGEAFFGPIMKFLVSLTYLVGVLVIGLFIYTSVKRREREYGVMKALGFTQSHVLRGLMSDVLVLLIAALPVALLMASAIAFLVGVFEPLYLVSIWHWALLAKVLVSALLISLLAILFPLNVLRRIDPVEVFKG